MPPGSSRTAKPKATDVAAETKKQYLSLIKSNYSHVYNTSSYLFADPVAQLRLEHLEPASNFAAPTFVVCHGDPVDCSVLWSQQFGDRLPVICPAHEKKPGGDWETGVSGYEERLCRRSTLSATLSTAAPDDPYQQHYPIPQAGGIYSDCVVIFRGPHDRYEKLQPEEWQTLPVCSITPVRWPKVREDLTYAFPYEQDVMKEKMRAALRICAHNRFQNIIIGDWALGNAWRNPPQLVAEMWREVILYDPVLRGHIRWVAFVFEDVGQCTGQIIINELAKKDAKTEARMDGSSKSKGKGKGSSSSGSGKGSNGSSVSSFHFPTDFQIFSHVFSMAEIERVLSSPDPRYGLGNIMAS